MDSKKGDMFDYLVSVMTKSEHFDSYLESEAKLKKAQAELKELEEELESPEEELEEAQESSDEE